jgi:hypothetical protein
MQAPLLDPGGVPNTCLDALGTAAFRPLATVGVPLTTALRDILLSTTIHLSGLDHAACILATPGSAHPLTRMHAGLLLPCWRGFRQVGLARGVLTYWVTTPNCMGFHPIPRFRAYLGATMALFGGGRGLHLGPCVPPPGRLAAPRWPRTPGTRAPPRQPPHDSAALGDNAPSTTRRAGPRTYNSTATRRIAPHYTIPLLPVSI